MGLFGKLFGKKVYPIRKEQAIAKFNQRMAGVKPEALATFRKMLELLDEIEDLRVDYQVDQVELDRDDKILNLKDLSLTQKL